MVGGFCGAGLAWNDALQGLGIEVCELTALFIGAWEGKFCLGLGSHFQVF